MKRKLLIGFICVLGLLVALWIIGRLTNAFQYYHTPTTSNEPTIKKGSKFFTSNLIEPKRFDFICYKTTSPQYEGDTWVHRLCGLPGDTVQIKSGSLYVNGKLADDQFNLANDYLIAKKDYEQLAGSLSIQ